MNWISKAAWPVWKNPTRTRGGISHVERNDDGGVCRRPPTRPGRQGRGKHARPQPPRAAGGRYPIQMAIADRALDPPGDFGSEHTDVMSARDQGWIMGWAETPQEIFDNTILYYRIGEDPKVMLPQFCCMDGYFVSHIPDKVVFPEQSQVDEFLPPYKPPHPLDPTRPTSHGPQIYADQGAAVGIARARGGRASGT